jgi:hypothetical protein
VVRRRAVLLALACVALGACASVLGLDKTYTLGAPDGGTSEGGTSDSGPRESDDGGASGIRCSQGGPTCTPESQECCFASDKSLSCISASKGCTNGTDIDCDQPSQCPSGQTCCISLQDAGSDLLATGCMDSCPSTETTLCARSNGTCAGGLQCKPLVVGAPFGDDWFYGCQ